MLRRVNPSQTGMPRCFNIADDQLQQVSTVAARA